MCVWWYQRNLGKWWVIEVESLCYGIFARLGKGLPIVKSNPLYINRLLHHGSVAGILNYRVMKDSSKEHMVFNQRVAGWSLFSFIVCKRQKSIMLLVNWGLKTLFFWCLIKLINSYYGGNLLWVWMVFWILLITKILW